MITNSKKLKEVQSVITALLAVQKKGYGIDTIEFDCMYYDTEGERIPFRSFGYSSLAEFLRAIPEVNIQSSYGKDMIHFAGKETTIHVTKLVDRQRSNKPRFNGSRSRYPPIPPHYMNQPRRVSPLRRNDEICEEILDIVQRRPKGLSRNTLIQIYLSRHPGSDFDNIKLSNHLKSLGTKLMVRDSMVIPTRNSRSTKTSTPLSNSVPPHRGQNANYLKNNDDVVEGIGTVKNYRVTLDSDGDDVGDFDDGSFDYVTSINKVGDKFIGYAAVDAKLKQTASDFIEESVTQNRENHLDTETSMVESMMESQTKTQCEQAKLDEDDSNFSKSQDYIASVLSERVQFRLEKLIQNNPDGIWCIDLPKKYREEYNIPLEWENLGFQHIGNFANHLPHIFHMVGPYSNSDYRLYDAKAPLPTDTGENNEKQKQTAASLYKVYDSDDDEIEAVPTNIPLELSNQISPDDVMANGESVGQISVTTFKVFSEAAPEDLQKAVRVVEAFSPSFFWIQIEKKIRKFEEMMKSLHTFYEEHNTKYMVPIIMLEKGLNVAVMFFGKWHRGIIKAVDPDCQVTVLFYDYGTVKSYPYDHIFYLNRNFSVLPAQAIPCGLYNVKPLDGENWPKDVIHMFIKRVHDRQMWAAIGSIDIESNSMMISLTDTSEPDDFHVSDWMFNKNMAIPGHMDIVDPKDLSNYMEDYGEVPEVLNHTEMHQGQSAQLDNVLKLPPGISNVAVEKFCSGLSILEKKQSIIMTTIDSINNLQNSIQKIILGYFGTILAMHATVDSEELMNKSEALAKTIIDEFHSALTIVETNHADDLRETVLLTDEKSCMDVSMEAISATITESNTHGKDEKDETPRSKLEKSIANACRNFLQQQESTIISDNSNVDQKLNPFVNGLPDTNPFKQDLLLNLDSAASSKIPPPLPPRPNEGMKGNSIKTPSSFIPQEGVKIVYQASPVLYDLSNKSITFDSPFETKLGSPETSFPNIHAKYIDEWKPVDLSTDEDDKGYQSDGTSTILYCSASQRNEQIMKVSDEVFHVDSQIKDKESTMNDGHGAEKSSMEKNFEPVRLTCNIVCIFHINGEGWIPVSEFRSTFTPFGNDDGLYQYIDSAMPGMPILVLRRAENSALFDRYDRQMSNWKPTYQSTGKRQGFKKSEDLALITLLSMMKILYRMGFIKKEEIIIQLEKNKSSNDQSSQAMADVIKLISTYGSAYGNSRKEQL